MDRRVCIPTLLLAFGFVFICTWQVPASKMAYFNSDGAFYTTARAELINSNFAKAQQPKGSPARPVSVNVARSRDIASNYEGPEILTSRCSSFKCLLTYWPAASGLAIPPCLFLLLAGLKKIKQLRSSPEFRSRAAFASFEKITKGLAKCPAAGPVKCERLLCGLRTFLSDRLMTRAGGFTGADFDTLLQNRGFDAPARSRLEQLWAVCERERFGGGSAPPLQWKELVDEALDIVRNLDKQVG
jgi:hypothetical protein